MKPLCLLLAAALLAGCATPLQTRSGRPEVVVNTSAEIVRRALLNVMVDNGYSARPGDTHNLVFEKDGGMTASIFLGTFNDPTVIKRVRFTIIEQDTTCRVVAGFAILSASSRRETEAPGKGYHDLQAMLNRLQTHFAVPYTPPQKPEGSDL